MSDKDDWQKYYHAGTSSSDSKEPTKEEKAKAEYQANLQKVTSGCLWIVVVIFAMGYCASLLPDNDRPTPAPARPVVAPVPAPAPKATLEAVETRYVNNQFIGRVKNTGTVTARFVKVNYVIRDADGNMLESFFTYTRPDSLEPGQTGDFTAFVEEGGQTAAITSIESK